MAKTVKGAAKAAATKAAKKGYGRTTNPKPAARPRRPASPVTKTPPGPPAAPAEPAVVTVPATTVVATTEPTSGNS